MGKEPATRLFEIDTEIEESYPLIIIEGGDVKRERVPVQLCSEYS